jgi:carbamoyl-phosphate synthase small subunit
MKHFGEINMSNTVKGKITLEDGTVFHARIWNLPSKITIGEIVFNTSMAGYQEILTDPSYANQFIVMTYPLIGNYGINSSDEEANTIFAKAIIAKEFCQHPENYQMQSTLIDYLKEHQITAVDDVDTRALTIHLRDKGTMKAAITEVDYPEKSIIDVLKTTHLNNTTELVTTKQTYTLTPPYGAVRFRVVLLDFGVKKNIVHSLLRRQCQVSVVPATTTWDTLCSLKPHGVLISNGPGDPKEHLEKIPMIKKITETFPTFGICMGHQLLSLALGGDTTKMKFGHRGANHPVLDLKLQRMVLTSQNHGYMTVKNSLKDQNIMPRFVHNNDESLEGFEHLTKPILSVQFHPEAHPGPSESYYLFDEFINLMASMKGIQHETNF